MIYELRSRERSLRAAAGVPRPTSQDTSGPGRVGRLAGAGARVACLAVGAGCGTNPYAPYWSDDARAPRIDEVVPASVDGLAGGAEVVLRGARLGTTRTVVFGGRNAEILSTSATSVTVALPAGPPGGGTFDVGLVTDDGLVRVDRAFTWDVGGWWDDEIASVAVQRVDCPAVAAVSGDEPSTIPWCGPAFGTARADGWFGAAPEPGLAGELAGYAQIATLPPVGTAVFRTGRDLDPVRTALTFGAATDGDRFEIVTERRFGRDVDAIEARATLASTRLGLDVEWPYAILYDDEACGGTGEPVTSADGDTLILGGFISQTLRSAQVGFLTDDAFVPVATAHGVNEQAHFISEETGFVLDYDSYTGELHDQGVAGVVGLSSWLDGVEYTVRTRVLGQTTEHGRLAPVTALGGVTPDLLGGDLVVDRAAPLAVTWAPLAAGSDPAYLVVELRVWDADVDDPTRTASDPGRGVDVARITAHAVDETGAFTLDPALLAGLPDAPNAVDRAGRPVGRWGELAVVRHELRKTAIDGGDLVVDFVSVVRSPVRVE